MRKKILGILCVAMMAMSLYGCGSTEAEKPVSNEKSTEVGNSESEESGLEYVELDWYVNNQLEMADVDIVNEALNEYLMEKLNCKVNLHIVPNEEFQQKVVTGLNSGADMGIVSASNGLNYSILAAADAFYPMDELIEKYGTGTKKIFSEDQWNAAKVNGITYGIPSKKDNAYIIAMIYNKTLSDALGQDMGNYDYHDWRVDEEFFKNALALRNEKFPEYVGQPLLGNVDIVMPYCFGLEALLDATSGLVVCNIPGVDDIAGYDSDTAFSLYTTDEYREYCLSKQRLVEAGVYAYDYTNYGDSYTNGALLATVGWGYTWIGNNLYGDGWESALNIPDKIWTDTSNYTSAISTISTNCADPERAMMILELANTDSYVATLLRFGVEGEHWTTDANGSMTFEGTKNEDPANRAYYYWYGAPFGNLTIVNAPESLTGPNGIMLDKMDECNSNAITAAHMGFVLDTAPISAEIAACNNVVSEYSTFLHLGRFNSQEETETAIDAFIEKLNANGLQKILEETQSQLDAWKSAN